MMSVIKESQKTEVASSREKFLQMKILKEGKKKNKTKLQTIFCPLVRSEIFKKYNAPLCKNIAFAIGAIRCIFLYSQNCQKNLTLFKVVKN